MGEKTKHKAILEHLPFYMQDKAHFHQCTLCQQKLKILVATGARARCHLSPRAPCKEDIPQGLPLRQDCETSSLLLNSSKSL